MPPYGLHDVSTFEVPGSVLEGSISFLREAGRRHAEAFVVWGGVFVDETTFRFTRALIPKQSAFSTPEGLMVVVSGDALFEVNKSLYENSEILGAQVHSHPTHAFHSDTDDHHPLVTLVGALSIVVPNFARRAPGDMQEWAWYRLIDVGRWQAVGEETEVVLT